MDCDRKIYGSLLLWQQGLMQKDEIKEEPKDEIEEEETMEQIR